MCDVIGLIMLVKSQNDWRKMEVCLINFNKGDDDILQYSEIEGNCVWKITDGLFRKYSTLRQHKCESPKNIIMPSNRGTYFGI
jgi:hypothetical protein